jgi:WD40 repeat protein
VTLVVAKQGDAAFEGHAGHVQCLAVSADGKRILTGSADTTVRLWDAATGEERATLSGHQKPVVCVALAGDGKRAFSIAADMNLCHWDLKKEAAVREVKLPPLAFSAAFSADAKTLAIGLQTGSVELWDPDAGKVSKVLDSSLAIAHRLAFSANGRFLAACDQHNSVRVWDLNTGKRRDLTIETVTSSLATDLAFSPDGRTLAISVSNRMIFLVDLDKGQKFRRVGPFPTYVHGVTLASDGKSVFVLSGTTTGVPGNHPKGTPMPRMPTNCCVVQVDVATGGVLQYWDDVPNIPIRGVFAPDGRHLIMAVGNTLKVWIPENGKTVTTGE